MIKILGISSISPGKVKSMNHHQERHNEHHLSDIQGWLSPVFTIPQFISMYIHNIKNLLGKNESITYIFKIYNYNLYTAVSVILLSRNRSKLQ